MSRTVSVLLAVIVFGTLIAAGLLWTRNPSIESLRAQARTHLASQRPDQALDTALRILQRDPADCEAALIAGRVYQAREQSHEALKVLRSALNRAPGCGACTGLAARIAFQAGFARDAERYLTSVLEANPLDLESANQLAYLLGVEGRAFEAQAQLLRTVRAGTATPHHLIMLAAGEPVVNDAEFVARCLKAAPDDPLPLLGQAREALTNQDFGAAEPLLRRISSVVPEIAEVQVRWGTLVLQRGTPAEFLAWNAGLPANINHPDLWVLRGQWARQQRESRIAVRCFWEALRHDPSHRLACYQLGQLLQELGRSDQSSVCLARAAGLEKLAYLVDRIYENPQAHHLFLEAAQLTESLGRLWEAWGWARGALLSDPQNADAAALMASLQPRLRPDLPPTIATADPGRMLDLSEFPLPHWKVPEGRSPLPDNLAGNPLIQFTDDSGPLGIHFVYDNGHEPTSMTTRMLESMGGGVAILDFDRDGWPDIYWTQAGPWELRAGQSRPPDALYRNLRGQSWSHVPPQGLDGDREFSQGCTVGDFDNDGFPDVYVANIGQNRLYRNQGDGTFRDVTEESGLRGVRWTSSCAIVDLNGDGLPDIYDVNYLSIDEAPRSLCIRGEEARTCGPGSFHAEPDQVFLNRGDGQFQDISATCGVDVPNGKGLGIVAGDLTESGLINVFVANDSVPNFYFVNETPSPGAAPRLREAALVSGLALSHDGLSAAWMGVAAGDANRDGRVDLFATTYASQSKSLFLQEGSGGLFTDSILSSGLNAPTWKPLGFGTQFLDGELDGNLDLVITNGHVFDMSHKQQPYHMAPQYFTNVGRAQFREVPATQMGSFFQGRYLGRGLARLDWNRDGLDDFAVSHMNAPAALVTNRTPQHGHFFTLRLAGTRCSRDAVGALVRVTAGTQSWTQQVLAGDGYQASNERQLHFGLGPATRVDEVVIRWPGGAELRQLALPADSVWTAIEGHTRLISVPQ